MARAVKAKTGAGGARRARKPDARAPVARPPADKILDAAETVVLRDGMGRLTLDAVAKECRLSKAGLLHHFHSKDALISAMVDRHVSAWHDELRRIYQKLKDAGETRPAVMAMMSTCLSGTHAWTESERARNRVMVAALVHDEKQVEPLRRVFRDVQSLVVQDDLPPGAGEAIHLAVHGLWFQWIFGMGQISAGRLRDVRRALAAIGGFVEPVPGLGSNNTRAGAKPASKRGVR